MAHMKLVLEAHLIAQGLEKLKIKRGVARRNIRECALTGFCFSGCKTDRKQSMLVTYLPWACNHGAEIYADTRVTRITTKNGQASGVEATIIDPKTKAVKSVMKVSAPIVVLAAGPIQSPMILQQSGIANSKWSGRGKTSPAIRLYRLPQFLKIQ